VDLGASNAKRVTINSDRIKGIQIDRTKLQNAPIQLKSYVLPTTIKSRAFVNDQRVVRNPGDIKNPVGVKNDHDVVRVDDNKDKDKDSDKSRTKIATDKTESGKKATPPPSAADWEKNRKSTEIKKSQPIPYQYNKQNYDKQNFQNGKNSYNQFDRDSQFQRNPSTKYQTVSPYRNFGSPYYRDGKNYGDDDRKTMAFPDRDVNPYGNPDQNGYDSKRDLSPRYFDEARRFFGRFDGNRQSVTKEPSKTGSSSGYKSPDYKGNSSNRVETRSAPPRSSSKPPSGSKPSSSYKKPPSNHRH
jgi:hypothetical protein